MNEQTKTTDCVLNYRGKVSINGTELDVINHATFNGQLHYGVIGTGEDGKAIIGWVPVALCEIVETKAPRYSISELQACEKKAREDGDEQTAAKFADQIRKQISR